VISTNRIPDLDLGGLAIYGDDAGAILDADGKVVDRPEPLVGELQQQA
jgi:hypothetical protein